MGVTGHASSESGTITIPSTAAASDAAWLVCWATASASLTGWTATGFIAANSSMAATLLRKNLTSADPGSSVSPASGGSAQEIITLDEVDGTLAPNGLCANSGSGSSYTPPSPSGLSVPGWSESFIWAPGNPANAVTSPGALTQDHSVTGSTSGYHLLMAHEAVPAGSLTDRTWTCGGTGGLTWYALVLVGQRTRTLTAGFQVSADSSPYDRITAGFQVSALGGPGILTAGFDLGAVSLPNDHPGPAAPALPSSWSPSGARVIQRVSETYPAPSFVNGQLVGDWEPA